MCVSKISEDLQWMQDHILATNYIKLTVSWCFDAAVTSMRQRKITSRMENSVQFETELLHYR